MSIEAVLGQIEFSADEPLRERRLPIDHALPALPPNQLARLARPEFFRAIDRFAVHPSILVEALDPRPLREILRRLEDPLLDQVRLDVFCHGKEEASDLARSLNQKLLLLICLRLRLAQKCSHERSH